MATPSNTPSTSSTPLVRLQFRLLDIQGNVITLAPDLDATAHDELRAEGGMRLVGDHRAPAFQAFVAAMRAAGGPYVGTPVLVSGALDLTPTPTPTTDLAPEAQDAVSEVAPVPTPPAAPVGSEPPSSEAPVVVGDTVAPDSAGL